MAWSNGIEEALDRMRDHLGDKVIKFDARDRQALKFILDYVASGFPARMYQRLLNTPGITVCTRPGCGLPTLTGGVCVTCEPR